jgi:hypothetical protein
LFAADNLLKFEVSTGMNFEVFRHVRHLVYTDVSEECLYQQIRLHGVTNHKADN